MTDIVDNEIEGQEAVKFSIPILQNIEDDTWQNNLWDDKGNINGNKCRTYRVFKPTLEAEQYLDLNILYYQRAAYVKLWGGVLPLDIEVRHCNRTPLESRNCKLCQINSIVSELHFPLDCLLYDDSRADMIIKALEVDEQFVLKNNEQQNVFYIK